MKTMGIIGANGFIGRTLVNMLNHYYNVVCINRDNYSSCVGSYDVIINANGNSKKYWANNNPNEDFTISVSSVYRSMFDFKCTKYIFISTADVYTQPMFDKPNEEIQIDITKQSSYGFNKFLAECVVKKHQKNFIILRTSAVVGKESNKGVVYDIIKGNKLFVTRESCIQCVSVVDVSGIVNELLNKNINNTVINVGGYGTTSVDDMIKMCNVNPVFSFSTQQQHYEMNVDKLKNLFPIKSSNYYVEEAVND